MLEYAKYVYELLKEDCKDIDAIYEEYIIHLVGVKGLNALHMAGLLESCGVMHGKKLFTLLEMKDIAN